LISLDKGEGAYLDKSVPSSRNDNWVGRIGGETHTTDPFSMTFFCDGEFAVSEGIPEFNGLVPAATDYLSVVGGERDGEDIVGVADESTGGFAGVEVPETKSFIP
jgi:hypothetical protein